MEPRQSYDSDVTDADWQYLEPFVPAAKPGGRPPKHTRRDIINGICYALRSGGALKLVPPDPARWGSVCHYFWLWRRQGLWEDIHRVMREWVSQVAGRKRQ